MGDFTPENAQRDWNRDLREQWRFDWAEKQLRLPRDERVYDTVAQALLHAPPAPNDLLPAETIVRIWDTGYLIMDVDAWAKLPARARKSIEKLCERTT
jgi:hypothetical protein